MTDGGGTSTSRGHPTVTTLVRIISASSGGRRLDTRELPPMSTLLDGVLILADG